MTLPDYLGSCLSNWSLLCNRHDGSRQNRVDGKGSSKSNSEVGFIGIDSSSMVGSSAQCQQTGEEEGERRWLGLAHLRVEV
jgi:hypothetical protein